MRRADRLFQIVQHLRGRRLTTAAQLAGWLEVSERTIYGDIRDLSLSGVPVAGARMVEAWGGSALARHVRSALAKITLALPKSRREEVQQTRMFAPEFHVPLETAAYMETVRDSIARHRKLRIEYTDEQPRDSRRTVRPLGLFFWGAAWSLAAWCELRQDFRNFRLDRIRRLEVGDEFEDAPGRTLDDYLKRVDG